MHWFGGAVAAITARPAQLAGNHTRATVGVAQTPVAGRRRSATWQAAAGRDDHCHDRADHKRSEQRCIMMVSSLHKGPVGAHIE